MSLLDSALVVGANELIEFLHEDLLQLDVSFCHCHCSCVVCHSSYKNMGPLENHLRIKHGKTGFPAINVEQCLMMGSH